ncbi:MAG TPA: S8 family serine peptidase [Actinomycetota bacterium]
MNVMWGISWNDSKKGALAALCAALMAASLAGAPNAQRAMSGGMEDLVSVIVREVRGSGSAPEQLVQDAGGDVGRHMRIIRGFEAKVPAGALDSIRRGDGVYSVTPNGSVHLNGSVDGYDPNADPTSWLGTAQSIKAGAFWNAGYTGKGIGVALIDSGVAPVQGLTSPGKVVNGADLSFEGQLDRFRHVDTYGHGTHMAGIIAGRDDAVQAGKENSDNTNFMGIAPDAHILNVKVASSNGSTDVSQVIAAIDWVVQHRNDNGMNIKVLNLSFGTDSSQSYVLDPLSYAAEVAWRKGIVVVVAAGNGSYGNAQLNNPAYNPHLIAVGANDTKGTFDTADDTVPEWSERGDGVRNPDLVAPGKSVVSLRDPNSYADQNFPGGRVGNSRFFKGSGTSQAAAVVSGAAALVLQQRPGITPDQVKKLLTSTASPLPLADPRSQGNGELNLNKALKASTPPALTAVQPYAPATGLGSLEAARGTVHVVDDTGAALTGEKDIFGNPWDGQSWSGQSWSGQSWSGGMWNGQSWSGQSWSGQSWSGQSWSGQSWSGQSWSGQSWSGQSWSGQSWSGQSWSGQSWSGQSWSGQSWSGQSWSGQSWSGQSWSGQSWSGQSWSGAEWN